MSTACRCLWGTLVLSATLSARPYPTGATAPTVAIGSGGVFVFGFAPDAEQNPVNVVYMAVESSPGSDLCYFSYWPSQNLIYLVGPSGEPVQSVSPRSNAVAQNSRCAISGSSSYSNLGVDGELTVGVSLSFKGAFPQGTKPMWAAAIDADENSGWVQLEDEVYCVRACSPAANQQPFPQPFAPPSRTSGFESFSFDFTDADGASDIATIQVLINEGLASANACNFSFDTQAPAGAGVLYLVDDPGGGQPVTIQAVQPGSPLVVSNSRCSIRGTDIAATRSGTTVNLRVAITLAAAGEKNIFLAAQDRNAGNSGWYDRGDWASPAALGSVSILYPTCGNAASCTEVYLKAVSSPALSVSFSIRSVGVAQNTFKNISVEYYRTSSCSDVTSGEIASGTPPPNSTNLGTMLSRPSEFLSYDATLGPGNSGTPGYYSARAKFTVNATFQGQLIVKTFYFHSNCLRLGEVPQISGVRDALSGQVSAVERGTEGPYLEVYGYNLNPLAATTITPSSNIPVWSLGYQAPSGNQVNLNYKILAAANSGARQFTLANGLGNSNSAEIWITDPTPEITTVTPDRPWTAGEVITVTLAGKGFGTQPDVTLEVRDGGDQVACLGSPQVTILGQPQDGSIQFSKAVPANSPGCQFDIVVTSKGTSGSFLTGPSSSPKPQSAAKRAAVTSTVSMLPIKVFIVHGLSDVPATFAPLAGRLTTALALPGGGNGGVVVDHLFAYQSLRPNQCDPLPTAAANLAAYVLARTVPYQRVAFVAHSMGGLVVRRMMADNLLPATPNAARYVVGFATLGTPHLGYPYLPIDVNVKCANQVQAMDSYLMGVDDLDSYEVLRTDFLRSLRVNWSRAAFGDRFFVAAGRACSDRTRTADGFVINGCRQANPFSDGVVCDDSANVYYPDSRIVPTARFYDTDGEFQHASFLGYFFFNVLCTAQADAQSLTNPEVTSNLFIQLVGFLNAL